MPVAMVNVGVEGHLLALIARDGAEQLAGQRRDRSPHGGLNTLGAAALDEQGVAVRLAAYLDHRIAKPRISDSRARSLSGWPLAAPTVGLADMSPNGMFKGC